MRLRAAIIGGVPALAAAVIGSVGSRAAPHVYRRLHTPRWAPPAAAFGPVWTVLYFLIGLAGGRMCQRQVAARTWALHAAQLACNAAWPATFFAIRDKRASFAVIAALDILLAAQIADLARQDRVAATALSPYLAWTLYATVLNASVSDPATMSNP